ncbi:MAG TPA: tetratricopeptide repeat protein, partial [Polyangia bacterium]
MAERRDGKGRRAPPGGRGAPADELVSSDDTTVMPGLMDADVDATGPAPTPVVADAEDVEVFVSSLSRAHSSGAYSSLVAGGDAGAPPDDEPPVALFPSLPEMSADIWQAGLRALVTVPEVVEPPWPDEEYWRDLGALFIDELALVRSAPQAGPEVNERGKQLELTMSAARVAERLGDGEMALRLVDDALATAPDAPEVWRARARLLEAAGDVEGAHEAWRGLAARITDADERDAYVALAGEWTFARRGTEDGRDAEAEAALAAIPQGAARALAEAELALRRGAPVDAARALEQAAFGTGEVVGAALLEAAACFHEVSGDAAAAAEQRFVAARMDAGGAAPPLGRLRDVARRGPAEIEAALAEIRRELGPSALGDAVAR